MLVAGIPWRPSPVVAVLLAFSIANGSCHHEGIGTIAADAGLAPDATTTLSEPPSAVCSEDGWCWVYPWPVGVSLFAAWVGPDGRRVVAGEAGVVALDEGGGWKGILCGMPRDRVVGLAGPDVEALVAITQQRGAFAFDGECWRPFGLDHRLLNAIWLAPWGDLYVTGCGGEVHRHDGERWSTQTTGGDYECVSAVGGSGPDDLYVTSYLTDPEGVIGPFYHFDGARWTPVLPERRIAASSIWVASPDAVFLAGRGLQRYDGHTLETLCEVDTWLAAVSGRGHEDIIAAGKSILHYDGSGCTETELGVPFADFEGFHALASAPGHPALAVGDAGRIFRDGPQGWQEESERLTDAELLAVWGSSSQNVFAVGRGGVVVHHNGQRWATMDTGIDWDLTTVLGIRPDRVYAAGYRDEVLVYDGEVWFPLPDRVPLPNPAPDPDAYPGEEGFSHPVRALWGTAWDNLYAASGNTVYHFDGQTWSVDLVVDAVNRTFNALTGAGECDVLAGGWGMVARYDCTSWRVLDLEDDGYLGARQILSIAAVDDQTYWLGGEGAHKGTTLSVYDGEQWFSQGDTTETFHGIWGSDPEHVFLVGGPYHRTELWHWDGAVMHSMRAPTLAPPNAIWGDGRGFVLTVGDRQILRRLSLGH